MASWNKLTYPRRLFLWLLAYSLLMVGCFTAFQYQREKEYKQELLNARLQGINSEILSEIGRGAPVAATVADFPGLRVSVISPEGRVIYDNSLDAALADNHLDRQEIARAARFGEGFTVRRHSSSTGENYFYSATRGADGVIVRTAVPYSVSLSELLSADMKFIWIMSGITLLMCLLGYFATRRLGLHISRLNNFAKMAERGERISGCAPFPKDELGSISNHIVRIYADLQQANADRDREHKAALFQQQEKERIKKQLTNNINHELKTPVAAIGVCLEILLTQQLTDAQRRDFLLRCAANTERLKHLLADVAQLTRMDDAPGSIAKEPLDLSEIISDTLADCAPEAKRQGFVIHNDILRPLPVLGNHMMLSSVVRNILDNAIAYSGGSVISLRLVSISPAEFTMQIADNGCGIPPEHLPRIFERFYRIDKGRSRAAGGTGLGLAIVKNAVILHGGSISASNLPGGGLAFTITLPCPRP